jgi:hypothetical protein
LTSSVSNQVTKIERMSQPFPFTYHGKKYTGSYEQEPVEGGNEYITIVEDQNLMNQLGACSVIILDKDPEWRIKLSNDSPQAMRAALFEGLENAIQIWRFIFFLGEAEQIGSAKKMWRNGAPLFSVAYNVKGYSDKPRSLDIYPIKGAGFAWGSVGGFPPDIVDALGAAIEMRLDLAGVDKFTPPSER